MMQDRVYKYVRKGEKQEKSQTDSLYVVKIRILLSLL